ncbi:MAG: squalene/phytoene synthase family protein [Elusimicrobiaceae bacterium]|nr:squalene/phytoene synthase family protein [Elusimicrobiaceae bacterium]
MKADISSYKKSSFGPAFLFLNKKQRSALAVYYAFCRLMDDIADEPNVENPIEELNFWQEEIERTFAGKATTDLGRDIARIVKDFQMPADRFLLLIEGMRADLQGKTYSTFEELTWYLWRVAGIVGLATLDILHVKGPLAEQLAQQLGFAVQITNIVRDVYDDVSLKRVYLPEDLLGKYGLCQQKVLEGVNGPQLAPVLKELAEKSKEYYRLAWQTMQTQPYRQMLPCRIMGFVYRKNLAKIEEIDFCFTNTIKLTKLEKLLNCIYALFKTNFID